jgi:hypothetical protein
MGWFHDEARRAAARQFGRRHYRWYTTAHLITTTAPRLAAAALTATAVAAAGYGLTHPATHLPWPLILRLTGAGLGLGVLVWLGTETLTGAGIRRRQAGHHTRIPALAGITALALLAAPLLLRH